MITIKHGMPLDRQRANTVANRLGQQELLINTDLIKEDIQKISDMKSSNISKIKKKNIAMTTSYLKGMLSNIEDEKVKISWELGEYGIYSTPIELVSIKQLGVDFMDYIYIQNSKIMCIDYKDMCNMIAFEIMYRDLDLTLAEIEEDLKDLGIVAVYPFSEISSLIPSNCYELGKVLKVEESPCKRCDNKGMVSYFCKDIGKSEYYRDVVEGSCKEALTIIIVSVISKLQDLGIDFKLCSIIDTGYYIMVGTTEEKGNTIEDIEDLVNECIYVSIFGRKFEVNPVIKVY